MQLAPALRAAAAGVPDGAAIVELGCWLGAGTAQLALGAAERTPPPTIHVYDRFEATEAEVGKAAGYGIRLRRRQDTLPVVRDLLAPFGAPIEFHRGSLLDLRWSGGPVGLQVDDAAKLPESFYHVVRTLGPCWIPGETVLVLMDYDLWRSLPPGEKADRMRVQEDFVTSNARAFEPIAADKAGTPTAFFRYLGGIEFDSLPRPPDTRKRFTTREVRRSLRRLIGRDAKST